MKMISTRPMWERVITFSLVDDDASEALIGDIHEQMIRLKAQGVGRVYARLWLLVQVFASIGFFFRTKDAAVLMTVGAGLITLGTYILYKGGIHSSIWSVLSTVFVMVIVFLQITRFYLVIRARLHLSEGKKKAERKP